MKKHLLITLSIMAINAYAMEIKTINLSPYSIDILDLIAHFLPFDDYETEQEFIKRTKTLIPEKIPEKYLNHLTPNPSQTLYSAYCPNDKIIALLQREIAHCPKQPRLVIIDKKNNQQLHSIPMLIRIYDKVAISRDGNILGTIHYHTFSDENLEGKLYSRSILAITNIVTVEKTNFIQYQQEYVIPPYFDLPKKHPTIAFNKQGTDIIIHGNSRNNNDKLYYGSFDDEKKPISHYIIVPLTVNTPDPNAETKKTLAKYCAQRGICKDLTKQLALT